MQTYISAINTQFDKVVTSFLKITIDKLKLTAL